MDITDKLTKVLKDRKTKSADESYVAKLYKDGTDKILKKIAEESAEYLMAVKNKDKDNVIYEAADLIFHLYVSLINEDIDPALIFKELERRFGTSGIEEKKSRKK